jgi:hypothetical protein
MFQLRKRFDVLEEEYSFSDTKNTKEQIKRMFFSILLLQKNKTKLKEENKNIK